MLQTFPKKSQCQNSKIRKNVLLLLHPYNTAAALESTTCIFNKKNWFILLDFITQIPICKAIWNLPSSKGVIFFFV